MSKKAYVVGVGMTKFMKPAEDNPDYPQMAKTAATRALYDAKINYNEVKAVAVGYVYGDSTCGQRY
jgi:acetyl-CoA acetyltransferase